MGSVQGEYGSYDVAAEILSKGGVGSIHRTDDPRWVFKRYLRPDKAPDTRQLHALVEIGREVLVKANAEPGQTPESSVNWPVDIVQGRDGAVTGVVLPAIPNALFNEYGKPRGLEFLVMARANPPDPKGRVALLLRMAEILAFIDGRNLIHGDVNGKNLVWTVSPTPVMYLIDCDGMVPQQPPPTIGVQAMGWTDPRVLDGIVPAHDQYSDWYALALAMYRGLLLTPGKLDTKTTGGKWPKPSKIPDSLGPRIAYLLHRALDEPLDARLRPPPDEWVSALVEEYIKDGQFRESSLAVLPKSGTARSATTSPSFTTLPSADWAKLHGPPQAPRARPPRPQQSTPRPQQPTPRPPVQPAPQRRPSPPPFRPAAAKPVGRVAQRALDRGGAWYVVGILACVMVSYLALIYIGVALYQLRSVSEWDPRLKPTRKVLGIYATVAAFVLFVFILGAFHLCVRQVGIS